MLKAKKSLGQNFLRSDKAVREIVESLSGSGCGQVIEIGGGEGVVTEELLKAGFQVTVVELDSRAVEVMSEKFKNEINQNKINILNKDVLKTDFSEIINGKKYLLVGNIPYYITGMIIRHIFEQKSLPQQVTLMVQKEVADRILAKEGKESILSLSVKVYGDVEYVSTVRRGSFAPAPKVDSAIFTVKNITNPFSDKSKEDKFFEIIKTAFRHPRKVAMGNLKKYLDDKVFIQVEKVLILHNCQNKRAEDIPLSVWISCSD